MEVFRKDQRVVHLMYGLGTVSRFDLDGGRVDVKFDQGETRELDARRSGLRWANARDEAAGLCDHQETFVTDDKEASHVWGSRWDPFYEDVTGQLHKKLPSIVRQYLAQTGFGEVYAGPFPPPDGGWPVALLKAWPLRQRGVHMVIVPGETFNEMKSVYPFCAEGCETTVTIGRVVVWEGGIEAQIEAHIGSMLVQFFDPFYVFNRTWYHTGESYQFLLCGIAYSARTAANEPIILEHDSPAAQALKDVQGRTDTDPVELHVRGMAVLLGIPNWDRDDYEFHGTVKDVRETDILGQRAWRVRATLLRDYDDDDREYDIDVLITGRAWESPEPPVIGEDIEGRLWLQGSLFAPQRWLDEVQRAKGASR